MDAILTDSTVDSFFRNPDTASKDERAAAVAAESFSASSLSSSPPPATRPIAIHLSVNYSAVRSFLKERRTVPEAWQHKWEEFLGHIRPLTADTRLSSEDPAYSAYSALVGDQAAAQLGECQLAYMGYETMLGQCPIRPPSPPAPPADPSPAKSEPSSPHSSPILLVASLVAAVALGLFAAYHLTGSGAHR